MKDLSDTPRFMQFMTEAELATMTDLADDGSFEMSQDGFHRFLCTMRDSHREDGDHEAAIRYASRVLAFNLFMYGRV